MGAPSCSTLQTWDTPPPPQVNEPERFQRRPSKKALGILAWNSRTSPLQQSLGGQGPDCGSSHPLGPMGSLSHREGIRWGRAPRVGPIRAVLHHQEGGHHWEPARNGESQEPPAPGPIPSKSPGDPHAHSSSSMGAGTGTPFVQIEAWGCIWQLSSPWIYSLTNFKNESQWLQMKWYPIHVHDNTRTCFILWRLRQRIREEWNDTGPRS